MNNQSEEQRTQEDLTKREDQQEQAIQDTGEEQEVLQQATMTIEASRGPPGAHSPSVSIDGCTNNSPQPTGSSSQTYVPKGLMVSEPGVMAKLSPDVEDLLARLSHTSRFPERPSQVEALRQFDNRERWLSRCPLEPPRATTEDGWETWFDQVALITTRNGLSTAMFYYLVEHAMPSAAAMAWGKQNPSWGYEHIVHGFMQQKFPISTYAKFLERSLFSPPIQPSVHAGREWLQGQVGRYVRACMREGRTVCMTAESVFDAAFDVLPRPVHRHISLHMLDAIPNTDLERLWTTAERLEARLFQEESALAMMGLVNRTEADQEWALVADEQATKTGKPSTPCGCCGGTHWMRECPHRSARCERCHRLGHIEPACKATVLKTTDGRIDVFILPRPGSTEFRLYKDRTQADRIRSAKNVLAEILGESRTLTLATRRSETTRSGEGMTESVGHLPTLLHL
eukprot:GHVS01100218.1.p1 GENE.GHVS01100218.1~~GHVS01100218.1.p1  ORF type:complete len:456 (-),score=28.68 GHVS01100218.1:669-2036(-)